MASTASSTAPAWRHAIKRAMKANGRNPASKYAQVATIKRDGSPAVRTVVIRGFLDGFLDACTGRERDALVFCTDNRSAKIGEIERDERGEMAWYFPETREQFRVTGTLATQSATTMSASAANYNDDARRALWIKMRRGARGQFLWPAPGGARTEDADSGLWNIDEEDAALDDERVGEHFTLVSFHASRIDHLALRSNERIIHEEINGEWVTTRVNP